MTPEFLANMHKQHYADVHDALQKETDPTRRIFLEAELQRHEDCYLYWSSHNISVMQEAGFEAMGATDGGVIYRM